MQTQRIDLELARHPSAPTLARRSLTPLHPNDNAIIVVGLLVSQAVMHGLPPISLTVSRIENVFWIEVVDGRTDLVWCHDDFARRILDNATTNWGVEERAPGKCVWAFVDA